jgi:hypothetical protein
VRQWGYETLGDEVAGHEAMGGNEAVGQQGGRLMRQWGSEAVGRMRK